MSGSRGGSIVGALKRNEVRFGLVAAFQVQRLSEAVARASVRQLNHVGFGLHQVYMTEEADT